MRSHLFYPYTHQCFMINYLKKKQNNIEKATLIRYQIRWRFFTEPGRVFHLPEHQSTIHHYVIHSNASLFLTYRHIPLDILPGYRSKVAPPTAWCSSSFTQHKDNPGPWCQSRQGRRMHLRQRIGKGQARSLTPASHTSSGACYEVTSPLLRIINCFPPLLKLKKSKY